MWQAVARSVRDNVIAEFVVQGVRLGGFVLLARALGPDQFGIFRVLLVVSVFATLTNDAGIPDALIQRKEITAAHEATAWWLSMLAALGATVVLYVTAPSIARAMDMPGLAAGARLLCLPILLDATTVVPSARLRRRLNFTALADLMNKPWAGDLAHRVWYFGAEAAERGNSLKSLHAPDFELPDLDGKSHRLSDYRGSKVLLLAWASW